MDLRRYVQLALRWSWLVVLGALLAGGAAYMVSRRTVPVYSATVTLRVSQSSTNISSSDYTSLITSEKLARTYVELLRTPRVMSEVAKKLNLAVPPAALAGRVQAQIVRDTQLVRVTFEDTDPVQATNIANTLVQVFKAMIDTEQSARYSGLEQALSDQLKQLENNIATKQLEMDGLSRVRTPSEDARYQQLQAEIAQYRGSYTNLLNTLTQVRLAEQQSSSGVTIVQEAQVPGGPIRPRPMNNAFTGALVGALLAAGVAFLIEYLDDTIKTADDVAQSLGCTMLASVARFRGVRDMRDGLVAAKSPRSPAVEAYRSLRTNLKFVGLGNPSGSLVITSAGPSEGKTTTLSNLGVVLAQGGKRVLIVDGDLRRPSLHKMFDLPHAPGLTDVLIGSVPDLDQAISKTSVEGLNILPAGNLPPNPAELLDSPGMANLARQLRARFDLVLFDSPPAMAVTDAGILSGHADRVLMVVSAHKTRREAALRTLETLQKVGGNVAGVILNRVVPGRGYGDYYYYHYHYDSPQDKNKGKPEAQGRVQ